MRTSIAIGLLMLAACLPGDRAGDVRGRLRPAVAATTAFRLGADAVAAPRVAAMRATGWHGGATLTAGGEAVDVEISDAYPPEAVSAQAWADFFGGLVHGRELAQLTVRIAPPDEVSELCGSADALGCYGGGTIVLPGEQSDGVEPEEIGRHEYGHHVAANRQNPPWRTIDWGTKRWATREDVCAQASTGDVHPGDEGEYYELNPGEAFAEAYRVLNERRAGSEALTWPLVDDRFLPDDATLADVERDVLQPWAQRPARAVNGRFTSRRTTTRRIPVATPLDGTLAVTLRLPRGRLDELELVSTEDRRVLARGLWTGSTAKRLSYEVCGRRSLELRITHKGPPGPYALVISRP